MQTLKAFKALLIASVLFLAACSGPTEGYKVNLAFFTCQERGGVHSITDTVPGFHIRCSDGSIHKVNDNDMVVTPK